MELAMNSKWCTSFSEYWKEHGSIARGRRMHMAASGPPLDKKGDYIRGGSEKRA